MSRRAYRGLAVLALVIGVVLILNVEPKIICPTGERVDSVAVPAPVVPGAAVGRGGELSDVPVRAGVDTGSGLKWTIGGIAAAVALAFYVMGDATVARTDESCGFWG